MRWLIFLISFFFSNVLLADQLSDSNTLFDLVEETYPQFFSPAGAETFTGDSESGQYLARYYAETDTYVATLEDDVYIFGDLWGLVKVGVINDFVDVTPPVIQLAGSSPLIILQNVDYEDAGATATDNIDGAVSVSSRGEVDTAKVGIYTITYTATDSSGNVSTAIRSVHVSMPFGINVSSVRGHTASYNAIAAFDISLISKPASDVVIPIESSDEHEGVTTVASLTFTPSNWAFEQTVVVKGRNSDVVDGEQDYQIYLAAAESDDPIYNGIDAQNAIMKGIALSLLEPSDLPVFILGLATTVTVNANYSGSELLSYSLVEKPEGMVIELRSGAMTWMPSEAGSFPVTVAVTDGVLFEELSFNIDVAGSSVLQTNVQAETLTITEVGNTLKGLELTVLAERANLSTVSVQTISDDVATEIPDYIDKRTDIFVIAPAITGDIEVRFPQSLLSDNASIFDLKLFHYARDLKGGEAAWVALGTGFDLEGSFDDPVALVKIHNMNGLYFIGLQKREVLPAISRSAIRARSADLLSISCVPFEKKLASGDIFKTYKIQDCEISGSNHTFRIEGFANAGDTASGVHWGGVSIEDVVVWLTEVQDQFDVLGMQYKPHFEVIIEERADFGAYDGSKLHVNSAYTKEQQHNTIVHEYFHHAELETLTSGVSDAEARELRYWQVAGNWIWEGMASWFTDYFDDSANVYLTDSTIKNPASRILEQGVSANAQDMFLWWKLLETKCGINPSLNLAEIFAGVMDSAWGAATLQTALSATSSRCDFGEQLGSEKRSSLAAALLYYQYATLYQQEISLLDINENDAGFKFKSTPYDYSLVDWDEENEGSAVTINVDNITKIPAYGAYSIKLNADVFTHENVDASHEAVFRLVSSLPLTVSLLSDASGFVGNSELDGIQHRHYQSNEQTEYIFGDGQGDFFITLLNPNDTAVSISELGFAIRVILTEELNVTSPMEGSDVNQRVISIAGEVPETATNVDRVIISNGDIKTVTTITADRTFTADVVVTMGSNTLVVQGYHSSDLRTPLTKEKILNVVGVENISGIQNALVPSRIAFVLRWATDGTDIDIYATDKNDATIWYQNRTVLPGNLDHDDTSGFGPEVISYRDTGDDVYLNGQFDIDIHYFSGSVATAYSLDVIMNENTANQVTRHYESTQSLPSGNSSEDGPAGSGVSRFNDVLSIICNDQKICSIGRIDSSRFRGTNEVLQDGSNNGGFTIQPRTAKEVEFLDQDANSYDKCIREYNSNMNKAGYVAWECDVLSGVKIWH